jgi:hypothetical protein
MKSVHMIENVISGAIRTSVNVTLKGAMVILGTRVVLFSFRSAAILPAQKSVISSPVTVAPGLSWMKAAGTST